MTRSVFVASLFSKRCASNFLGEDTGKKIFRKHLCLLYTSFLQFEGNTALSIAKKKNRVEMIPLLRDAEDKDRKAACEAAKTERRVGVKVRTGRCCCCSPPCTVVHVKLLLVLCPLASQREHESCEAVLIEHSCDTAAGGSGEVRCLM
jgi:hypothetical protein